MTVLLAPVRPALRLPCLRFPDRPSVVNEGLRKKANGIKGASNDSRSVHGFTDQLVTDCAQRKLDARRGAGGGVMPASITVNEEPAADAIRDGLDLIRTTTLTLRKDSDHDLLPAQGVRVQHNAALPISHPLAS